MASRKMQAQLTHRLAVMERRKFDAAGGHFELLCGKIGRRRQAVRRKPFSHPGQESMHIGVIDAEYS